MDTKSKKYKRTVLKGLCVFLCLLCVGTSVVSALSIANFAVRAGYFYGLDNFSSDPKSTLYDPRISSDFLREVGFSYYAIKRNLVTYRNGEVFEGDNVEAMLAEKRRQLTDEMFREYVTACREKTDAYNKHLTAESQPDYDSEHETTADDGYYYDQDIYYFRNDEAYIINADGTVSVDEEYVMSQARNDAEARSDWDTVRYENEYKHLNSYLSQLKSLEYFVVNNATGESFTNSGFATAAEFSKAYSEDTWFVSSSDNFNTVTAGPVFESLSRSTVSGDDSLFGYYTDSSKIIQTKDGIILGPTAYIIHFFSLMHYGYYRFMALPSHHYVIGSTELFDTDPFTVYLSFDYSRAAPSDPFVRVYEDYTQSVGVLERSMVVCLVSLALSLVVFIVFCFISGKGYKGSPAALRRQDKIPGELHFIVSAGVFVLAFAAAVQLALYMYNSRNDGWSMIITPVCVVLAMAGSASLLNMVASINRRRLNNTLFDNLLVCLPFKLIAKVYRRISRNSTRLKDGVRRYFRFFLLFYLITVAVCVLLLFTDSVLVVFGIIGLVLANAVMLIAIYSYARSLDKIRDTVSQAQQGNFDVEFDCGNMPAPMTRLAHEIEDMREGMKQAIEAGIRDQRTKTELITNVSHDLKTPLTSIITYTDLIKRSNIEDETVRGYVDVLAEKSQRLKRLIEDLTEATKASTGAVELQIVDVNLHELAMQAVGENTDRLEQSRIDVRFTPVNGTPIVRADGQKTYRVFENIISNIAKYALEDTVAYVMVGIQEGYGTATFKNISREPLNVSTDQLMERFVRGDFSRSGEGSGLGLSIARDLCSLQGGSFDIYIDGDMFTARVALPLTENIEKYQNHEKS
ncbi:MAG: HAMP domain-containing histidine kinase [Clostridia bacterium]|nr:HAMP domain-containing histidine kinase [Clostridia bacterium]